MGGRGGSPAGGRPVASLRQISFRAKQTLREAEAEMRDQRVEHLIAVDSEGRVLATKVGGDSEVALSRKELASFKDANISHNHPDLGHGDGDGGTFSPEDIDVLVRGGANSIRAVSPGVEYTLERTTGIGSLARINSAKFFGSYDAAYDRIWNRLEPQFNKISSDLDAGRISRQEADRRIAEVNKELSDQASKWLKSNANAYGYTYTVRRRK